MTTWKLEHNDILEWAKGYTGEPFHALFCDPPYHLTSITKRFGKAGSAPAKGDVYNRASKGFMGAVWDGGDISFRPETWAALGEHLYPGAFGLAFASPRNQHRMVCAIEDAGFIIQPTVYGYCYLSGFPKATRVKGYGSPAFRGYRYGGQALKPMLEPLVCFQKPYEGRPLDNIVVTGAGVLNIEAGRIGTDLVVSRKGLGQNRLLNDDGWKGIGERPEPETNKGRWPGNLYLHHSPACNGECVPDCPVRLFDEQSGNHTGGSPKTGNEPSDPHKNVYGKRNPVAFAGYEDDGPASRMMFRGDWSYEVSEQLAAAGPLCYKPKASVSEREAGLDDLPIRIRHRVNSGGLENEPRFAPKEAKNHHPTVKSISVCKYWSTLLLPPIEYAPRRILVPFCGVASEMVGCILAGWEEVIGIESNAAYVQISEARLRWWSQWPGWGQTDVDAILAADKDKEDDRQLSLFSEAA